MNKSIPLFLGIAIGILILINSVFFVPESKQAIILELGRPLSDIYKPGLHFKLPFIQTPEMLEDRIMAFSIDNQTTYSFDASSFDLDCYVCWRITNPHQYIKFFRSTPSAEQELKKIVLAQLKLGIGEKTLGEVVGISRNIIMQHTLAESNKTTVENYGVTFVDVRIKRADLPNRPAIFAKMTAEREKIANEYRYSGESMAKQIRSEAELDRDTMVAEAHKTSLIIQGKADAEAQAVLSQAIETAPEFYEYIKSLELYKESFINNTKIILSTDDPLLQFFQ